MNKIEFFKELRNNRKYISFIDNFHDICHLIKLIISNFSLLEKIEDWMDNSKFKYEYIYYFIKRQLEKICDLPRNICYFIENFIYWFPILVFDRDWDYDYLLNIVKFKIKKMEKKIRKDNYHVGCEKKCLKMREVIEHINHYRDIYSYSKGLYEVEDGKILENYNPTYDKDGNILTTDFKCEWSAPLKEKQWVHRNCKHYPSLECWHWSEMWRKISKYGRRWWD